jgi:hypothetical protein
MRELYERLAAGDAALVRALAGRREQVDFDCKRKADPSHPRLETSDKQNLGVVLSAFSNSMGGLLLWGVDARKDAEGFDAVIGFRPISDIARFAENVRSACSEVLMPRVEHVDMAAIEDPAGSGSGYLAIIAERSEKRPHRCEVGGVQGYYRRSLSSSRQMEHYEIEDAFKRNSLPHLEVSLKHYRGMYIGGAQNCNYLNRL